MPSAEFFCVLTPFLLTATTTVLLLRSAVPADAPNRDFKFGLAFLSVVLTLTTGACFGWFLSSAPPGYL